MRRGSVFRRCTSCRKRIKGRRCPCGKGEIRWTFVVDLAPAGSPRRQVSRGGFRTEPEATAAMNRLQSDRAEGLFVEPSTITVAAYLLRWVKGLELPRRPAVDEMEDDEADELRGSTITGYEVYVRLWLAPRFEGVLLQQLTRAQVRAVYRAIRGEATVRGRLPRAKTVWNIHLCLHRALEDAIKDGLIRVNPADKTMTRPRARPEVKFWVGAELASFLGDVDDLAERTLYRVAGQTGMRLGELLGLRWRDVDWTSSRVSVQQQLARRRGGGYAFGPPKSERGRRTIDVSPETLQALRVHQAQQAIYRRAWGDAYQAEHDLVFGREDGSHHDATAISKRFGRLVAGTPLPRLRFHDLRHTAAVIGLRELGEWPDETSARLGHASVAFTLETYGHLLPKRGREVAVAFDRLLAGAGAA